MRTLAALLLALAACADEPNVTWHRDVLPVVQTHCQGCHAAGGIGPMPLLTYEDARVYAGKMADKVVAREMPPWKPSPDCQSFKGDRRLTQAEIDTIVAWKDAQMPEGDPKDAPPAPARAALSWVDATLSSGVDYIPSAAFTDDYRCFILDPELTADRDVVGFDIEPTARAMVHHVLLYSADAEDARSTDAAEAGPGWTCFGGPGTEDPNVIGGWVPGTPVTQYPAGTGVTMEKGKVLVMQIHYNTTRGVPGVTSDQTVVKLQYDPLRVPRRAIIIPQPDGSFAIPPGAMGHSTTDDFGPSPIGFTLWGVLPHMHTLGKRIKVEGVRGAETQCLIDIPEWDFHWQQFYFYEAPISVEAGDSVRLTCTWDNPTDRTVRWGESTSDEMCLNYYYVSY